MLKAISTITNALGALNYKGTWNASSNTPTLTSSVGAKGDYYVVSVAGSTNLNGETLWGVGDWAVFNGSVWQRVEGGDTINATTVTASTSVTTPIVQATNSSGLALKNSGGTTQLSLGAGGGDNITISVATSVTDNLIQGTAAKGFNFTANTPAAGMSSQLLNWYEEGVWTTAMTADGGTVTLSFNKLNYTRSGRIVSISGEIVVSSISSPTGDIYISLPFTTAASVSGRSGSWSSYLGQAYTFTGVPLGPMLGSFVGSATKMTILVGNNAGGTSASGFLTTNTTFVFGFTYQCQ